MAKDLEFVTQVLGLISLDTEMEYPELRECIWWRTDSEYAPVSFFVTANDLFAWACAEAIELTPENFSELPRAIKDVWRVLGIPEDFHKIRPLPEDLQKKHWDDWFKAAYTGASLFCCRVEKMRPQRLRYSGLKPEVAALFDAAGPERKD